MVKGDMRFAYADPPYIGCAKRHYKDRPDYAGEVDHQELLERLYHDFPNGWTLSSHMKVLWDLLPMIPKDWKCRIAAWCKPFSSLGAQGWPLYAWEPVIYRGGRKREKPSLPPYDWLVTNPQFAAIGHPGGNKKGKRQDIFKGAKSDEFCYWIFDLLNMQPGDEFVDLFPGTGRVMRAWERYKEAGVSLFVGEMREQEWRRN